jgi:hypothetical protein
MVYGDFLASASGQRCNRGFGSVEPTSKSDQNNRKGGERHKPRRMLISTDDPRCRERKNS